MDRTIIIPPQDIEAEKAVLGALMLQKDRVTECLAIFPSPDCFYAEKHAKIYKSILSLVTKGIEVDTLTVTDELKKSDDLEFVGGVVYLIELTDGFALSNNIEAYARIIVEKFILRELFRIGSSISGTALKGETDVFELIDKAQTEIYQLTNNLSSNEPKHIGTYMSTVLQESEVQRNSKSEVTGVKCGIADIDNKTHGWQDGDLIVIGARPAVGKTAFSLNLGLGAAQANENVLIFSLEMSAGQLIRRLASNFLTIEANKLFNPVKLTNDEWGIYVNSGGDFGKVPIYIDDTASLTTAQIRSKAYKLINKGVKLDLIIIDYLQLISSNHLKGRSRENEVSAISRDLKILAKDLHVPVIVLSQLNRAGEGKPTLANLRESGAIEQDADIVMFLYNGEELSEYVMLEWAKFRNGSTDSIALNFQKQFQRFISKDSISNQFPILPENPRTGIRNIYEAGEKAPF